MALPRYLVIVADIAEAIRSGALGEGDPVPSLADLMDDYGVSQSTASKAIRRLIADGHAVGRPGVGVFVRAWRPLLRIVPDRFAGDRSMVEQDARGRAVAAAVAVERATPPAVVAELLGDDRPALVRRRVHAVDGRPVQLSESWVPGWLADLAPQLEQEATGPGGMWGRLADAGHGPAGPARERWRVRPATEDERDQLALPPASRVLYGYRVVRDAAGAVVDATVMTLAEGAYDLEFRFDL